MNLKFLHDRRPRIACEFSSTRIVAARKAENGMIDNVSVQPLEPGSLTPDLNGANLADGGAVRTILQNALAAVDGTGRDLAVVMPDASYRLALIDVDVLPERQEEIEPLVRHRLKRSLPFDVDKAHVCWQTQLVNGKTHLLAGAVLRSVLDEYEAVVRDAGFNPGLVLPATLASLRLVDAEVPTVLIRLDPTTTSIVIVHHRAVVLVRLLDRVSVSLAEQGKLGDAVYSSLMYFQDVYGTKVQKVLISGAPPSEALMSEIEQLAATRPQELASSAPVHLLSAHQPYILGAVYGSLA